MTKQRGIPGDLGEGRGIRTDHRTAACHRLEDRKAESLIPGGKDKDRRMLIQLDQRFIRYDTAEDRLIRDPFLGRPVADILPAAKIAGQDQIMSLTNIMWQSTECLNERLDVLGGIGARYAQDIGSRSFPA